MLQQDIPYGMNTPWALMNRAVIYLYAYLIRLHLEQWEEQCGETGEGVDESEDYHGFLQLTLKFILLHPLFLIRSDAVIQNSQYPR